MATLNEATRLNNLEGYEQIAPSAPKPAPPVFDLQPTFNPYMRSPYPISGSNPDGLRQFYQGTIPQNRLLPILPAPTNNTGAVSTITNVQSVVAGGTASGNTGSTVTLSDLQVSHILPQSTSITTPVLGPGSRFSSGMLISRSFQLLKLTTSDMCRVTLYGTAAACLSDAGRGLDVAPLAGTTQNIISDIILDTAPFTWAYQDQVGCNGDSPQNQLVYIAVTDIGASSVSITVTLQYVPIEA